MAARNVAEPAPTRSTRHSPATAPFGMQYGACDRRADAAAAARVRASQRALQIHQVAAPGLQRHLPQHELGLHDVLVVALLAAAIQLRRRARRPRRCGGRRLPQAPENHAVGAHRFLQLLAARAARAVGWSRCTPSTRRNHSRRKASNAPATTRALRRARENDPVADLRTVRRAPGQADNAPPTPLCRRLQIGGPSTKVEGAHGWQPTAQESSESPTHLPICPSVHLSICPSVHAPDQPDPTRHARMPKYVLLRVWTPGPAHRDSLLTRSNECRVPCAPVSSLLHLRSLPKKATVVSTEIRRRMRHFFAFRHFF